jgi:hypothetical protein
MRLVATALVAAACASCGGSKPAGGCADPLTIDDMEDNDRFICASSGRTGAWYTITDGTSTSISPTGDFTQSLTDGRGGSRYAAHMTGFGFADWGAAMGFSLNGEGTAAEPHDASAAGGVRFWMKSTSPVVVDFPTPATVATGERAGTCVDDDPSVWNCRNHFQFRISAPPKEWKEYDVPFAALTQSRAWDADGNFIFGSATWNPSKLLGVEFRAEVGQTFDVWVDDVRFYDCAGPDCLPTCTDADLPVACPATSAAPATCRPAGTACDQPAADLLGVWGSAANDVWVVGNPGANLRWNGETWLAVPSGTTESLRAVWGSGTSDVWAVGGAGAIVHWDGTTWTAVPSGTTQTLCGVWSSGPNDAWAVGGGGAILHWDGVAWTPSPSGTSYSLWRVWGSGPTDVYAVGWISGTVMLHWDGDHWSSLSAEAPVGAIGLGGTGPRDVWVVGLGPGVGDVSHWDGESWSMVPTDATMSLVAIWASDPDDAWIVGYGGSILHWNGSAWSSVPSPPTKRLMTVWGSGPDDVWAVGLVGTIEHWDGSSWYAVLPGVQ